jgi:hypothetical protein
MQMTREFWTELMTEGRASPAQHKTRKRLRVTNEYRNHSRPTLLFAPTPKAAKRVPQFFTAQINDNHTRKAYLNAIFRLAPSFLPAGPPSKGAHRFVR